MIKINLLPQDFVRDDSKNDIVVISSIAGIAIVLLLAGFYVRTLMHDKALDKALETANINKQKYEAINTQIIQLQANNQLLEARKGVIDNLIKGRLLYSIFMYDFVSILPDKVWLQRLSTKTAEDNSLSVDLGAKAFSTFSIADLITALESFPSFTFDSLGSINVSKQENNKIFTFDMKLQYRKQQ